MHAHRQVEHGTILQGAAHQVGVHYRPTVIGDRYSAFCGHLANLGQFFALEPFRERTDRQHPRQVRRPRSLDNVAGDRAVVVDRVGVGHAGDGGEPTGHCRLGAGQHGLFVLVAGLAQVDMHIDEARGHDQAAGVNARVSGREKAAGSVDPANQTVLDQQVTNGLQIIGRIDHRPAVNNDSH